MKEKAMRGFSQKARDVVFLHLTILLFTGTTVLSKYIARFDFLSTGYILIFGGMFVILGVYAILWQQVIKRFSPSVAYSNKSATIVWTLLYSALIFGEGITLSNVIGAAIIITGIILVAQND